MQTSNVNAPLPSRPAQHGAGEAPLQRYGSLSSTAIPASISLPRAMLLTPKPTLPRATAAALE